MKNYLRLTILILVSKNTPRDGSASCWRPACVCARAPVRRAAWLMWLLRLWASEWVAYFKSVMASDGSVSTAVAAMQTLLAFLQQSNGPKQRALPPALEP